MWIGVALAGVAAAIVAVLLLTGPLVQNCYYVLGEPLLSEGETPAPTPSGMENGYYCIPPN
jgi:hypothetical protein